MKVRGSTQKFSIAHFSVTESMGVVFSHYAGESCWRQSDERSKECGKGNFMMIE